MGKVKRPLDNIKCTQICIIQVPKEKREKETEKIFKEKMNENFTKEERKQSSKFRMGRDFHTRKAKKEHAKTHVNQIDKT